VEKQRKGNKTSDSIVDEVNRLLNRTETMLTLDEIASELKLNRSRITNYFPKKELLILAIYHRFTNKLNKLIDKYHPDNEKISMGNLVSYYSKIMDLLYDYRFAISYLFANPLNDDELSEHLQETYSANKNRLLNRVKILIDNGLIDKSLQDPEHFEAFSFQHANLLTTWIISFRLYDRKSGYKNMKPVYLRGLLNCYFMFLTEEGKKEMTKYTKTI
jgi:AcrR family transcriptional regulator